MHPWVQYQIRRIEIDDLHAQVARERLLKTAARTKPEAEREPPLPSRLDRALARLGTQLTRLGQRLEGRAKPIPRRTCSNVRT